MRFQFLAAAVLFLLAPAGGHASELPAAETRNKVPLSNFEALRTSGEFIMGPMGFAATISGQETAFRQLLKEPDAAVHCQQLLTDGTPAGQLYGLLGLQLLDPPAYQAALPRYRDSKVAVHTIKGCVGFNTTVAEVVKDIEKGQIH